MSRHIAIACTVATAQRVADALAAMGWGRQWIDEPLVQTTDDDGFVLGSPPSDAAATVHAWPTDDDAAQPEPPPQVLGLMVTTVDDDGAQLDWTTAWRAAHPIRTELLPGWALIPPWGAAQPGEQTIVVEPGGAFGTGLHATTRECLRVLHDAVVPGALVVDVGTGSGVLAIAAVRWGAADVWAIDVDPGCEPALRANQRWNGIPDERIRFAVGDARVLTSTVAHWHVAVCNVGAAALISALPAVAAAVVPGGTLIGSGIWAPSAASVRAAAHTCGLVLRGETAADGWHTIRWSRGSTT